MDVISSQRVVPVTPVKPDLLRNDTPSKTQNDILQLTEETGDGWPIVIVRDGVRIRTVGFGRAL